MELNRNTLLVSAKGGTLDYVSEDGEVLFSVAVPPGRVPASDYLDLCPEGAVVQISKDKDGRGLVAIEPPNRSGVVKSPDRFETGANPDYQPTSADTLNRQLLLHVNRLAANQRSLEAKLLARQAVEVVPKAPSEPPADDSASDVVES